MQKSDEAPVNPFLAVYYAAQRAPDLINGTQQDIHEFWLTLKDLLNADADPKVAFPANANMFLYCTQMLTSKVHACQHILVLQVCPRFQSLPGQEVFATTKTNDLFSFDKGPNQDEDYLVSILLQLTIRLYE